MEILLIQNVESLGERGDRVNVARGYYRNYLYPRGFAVLATDGNFRALAEDDKVRSRKDRKNVVAAEGIRDIINGVTISFKVQVNEEGHLYGSVNEQNIAKELLDKGYQVGAHQVEMAEHIKKLGEYDITLALHKGSGIEANIKVVVSEEKSD
jgi:large subunit ribosomal protein L9